MKETAMVVTFSFHTVCYKQCFFSHSSQILTDHSKVSCQSLFKIGILECKSFSQQGKFFTVIGYLIYIRVWPWQLHVSFCSRHKTSHYSKIKLICINRFSTIWLYMHSKNLSVTVYLLPFVLWAGAMLPSSSLSNKKLMNNAFLLLQVSSNYHSKRRQAINLLKFFYFSAHNSKCEHIRRRQWECDK